MQFYNLGYNSLLPSYVFVSNISTTGSCIFESIILNIPCSTLMDSNMGFYGIFYGLPSNDDNFVSIYLFTRLFIKIYLKAVYDNINSLKMKKSINIRNDNLNIEIKSNLRFDRKLKLRFWSKYKYFMRNKNFKKYAWSSVWLKKRKFKDNVIFEWRKRKEKLKLLKKNKKNFWDVNKKLN